MTDLPDIIAHLRQSCADAGGVERWANRQGVYAIDVHRSLAGLADPNKMILGALGYQSRPCYSRVTA